jgi:hypothetical protein
MLSWGQIGAKESGFSRKAPGPNIPAANSLVDIKVDDKIMSGSVKDWDVSWDGFWTERCQGGGNRIEAGERTERRCRYRQKKKRWVYRPVSKSESASVSRFGVRGIACGGGWFFFTVQRRGAGKESISIQAGTSLSRRNPIPAGDGRSGKLPTQERRLQLPSARTDMAPSPVQNMAAVDAPGNMEQMKHPAELHPHTTVLLVRQTALAEPL